jgi:apolipoprotein N-acyltransferase
MSSATIDQPDSKIETQDAHWPRASGTQSWIWLASAGLLLLFANGAYAIPLAAWLAPLFLLRFVRTTRSRLVLPAAWVLLSATFMFQVRGMVPFPALFYCLTIALFGATLLVPYLLDRWLAPRLSGMAATLVFPASWVAVEYLRSLSPIATWGSAAYSQYGNLPLVQVASVTGLWGITFLIGWSAAAANQLWLEGTASKRSRRAAWAFAATLAAVLLAGGARLVFDDPSARAINAASDTTVRVASLSPVPGEETLPQDAVGRLLADQPTTVDLEDFHRWSVRLSDDLLTRSEREARAGACIIFWGESNYKGLKADEDALIERGRALTRKYRVYLGMGIGSWNRGQPKPLENKILLLTPDGEIAWQYFKTHPVPGGEAAISMVDDGRLPVLDTPHGRLSSVVCYDADFPQLLAQAGALRADILLDPSNDWPAIDPLHTWMASFRAIEQGVNLIRQTSNGLSAAYDYHGRVLAAVDYYRTKDPVMVAYVPTRGVRTIYSVVGDAFAWLCLGMLALLVLRSWQGFSRTDLA